MTTKFVVDPNLFNVVKNVTQKFNRDILKLVTLAGQIMLENGAETYRVEDTIEHICRATNIKSVNTFATPTGIFICIQTPNDEYHTTIKRVTKRTTNLSKVYHVNNISRQFVLQEISITQALSSLEELSHTHSLNILFSIFVTGVCSGFFALLLGGALWDGMIATFCGGFIRLVAIILYNKDISGFLVNLVSGSITAMIAILFSEILKVGHIDKIIIGSIMPLLPGIAITGAIRDTIYGDLVSGTSRGVEALLIAISIASGVGIVLRVWLFLQGGL
ncbi:MAG: hypothetical protein PWP27_271 [Clostridiales bacterium]|nr:hypothetical protein [Clostridiales bacterium]MDK2932461.1 hypothetical protein [Clostridiales bacterium]